MPFPISIAYRPAGSAVVAAVVAAIAASPLLTGSAAPAQTTGAPSATSPTSPTSPPSPGDGLNMTDLLAQLRSPDATQRQRATKQFLKRHGTQGKELLEIARKQVKEAKELQASQEAAEKAVEPAAKQTKAEQEAKEERFWEGYTLLQQKSGAAAETIQLLGNLRVEEAIPFLVENSRFIDHRADNKLYFYPYRFPCLGALTLIGLPAADVLLRTIEENATKDTAGWHATLLAWTLGPSAAAGFVQDRINNPVRPQQIANGVKLTIPISVRVARLEAVRAVLVSHGRERGDRRSFLEDHAAFLKNDIP